MIPELAAFPVLFEISGADAPTPGAQNVGAVGGSIVREPLYEACLTVANSFIRPTSVINWPMQGRGEYSLSAWLRCPPTASIRLLSCAASNETESSDLSITIENGLCSFREGSQIATFPCAIQDGAWRHVAIAHGGGRVRLFIDGVDTAPAQMSPIGYDLSRTRRLMATTGAVDFAHLIIHARMLDENVVDKLRFATRPRVSPAPSNVRGVSPLALTLADRDGHSALRFSDGTTPALIATLENSGREAIAINPAAKPGDWHFKLLLRGSVLDVPLSPLPPAFAALAGSGFAATGAHYTATACDRGDGWVEFPIKANVTSATSLEAGGRLSFTLPIAARRGVGQRGTNATLVVNPDFVQRGGVGLATRLSHHLMLADAAALVTDKLFRAVFVGDAGARAGTDGPRTLTLSVSTAVTAALADWRNFSITPTFTDGVGFTSVTSQDTNLSIAGNVVKLAANASQPPKFPLSLIFQGVTVNDGNPGFASLRLNIAGIPVNSGESEVVEAMLEKAPLTFNGKNAFVGGKLGVGVLAPQAALDVVGGVRTDAQGVTFANGGVTAQIKSDGAGALEFATGGQTEVRMSGDGGLRVGNAGIGFDQTGDAKIVSDANRGISFYGGGKVRLHINSTGGVGFGDAASLVDVDISSGLQVNPLVGYKFAGQQASITADSNGLILNSSQYNKVRVTAAGALEAPVHIAAPRSASGDGTGGSADLLIGRQEQVPTATNSHGDSSLLLRVKGEQNSDSEIQAVRNYGGAAAWGALLLNALGGNVGVGTSSPLAPLHIGASVSRSFNANALAQGVNENSTDNAFYNHQTHSVVSNISLKCDAAIEGTQVFLLSDARGKIVIGSSDGARDLARLMAVRIVDYRRRDYMEHGVRPQKKVLAQELEQVYPEAVSAAPGTVPDIYETAQCADGWIELATDLAVGERVRIVSVGWDATCDVVAREAHRFRVGPRPPADGLVLVYGRMVEDSRTVDYDAISMLNVSATQQLKRDTDRELAALREEIRALRLELAELKAARGRTFAS